MAEKEIAQTPMMKQFLEFKAKHPDAILLFRCGDFYETYSNKASSIVHRTWTGDSFHI